MTWIKNKIIKFKKWLIALVIGGVVLTAGILTPKEQSLIDSISVEQTSYFQIYGKYKQIKSTTSDEIKYEVHEYKTSKGEAGYQAVFIFPDRVKSVGYGVEAKSRTYEYPIEIPPIKILTATST